MGGQGYGARVEFAEANDARRNGQSRWQQQFGTGNPEAERASLQDEVLERLIRARLIGERSRDARYRVSAARVRQEIEGEPAFQVDGKYSETLALARLAQVGSTADQFRNDIRTGLQNAELERGLDLSEFLTATEIGRRLGIEDEQREVRVAVLPDSSASAARRSTRRRLLRGTPRTASSSRRRSRSR